MNTEQSIETGPQPTLTLNAVQGNLTVRGWDENRIVARPASGALQLQGDPESGWRLTAPGDAYLSVPRATRLVVQDAHGDSRISGVTGELIVQRCQGNLVLANGGPATLGSIGGDANLHMLTGGLSITSVAGNLATIRIQGPLQVHSCAGDLAAKEIQGPVEIGAVAGNAVLSNLQGPLEMSSVAGDLAAREVAGPVTVNTVQGNVALAQIHGPVQVEKCAGDLVVRGVTGSIEAQAAGNAGLRLQLPVGVHCQIHAGGDIRCRVSPQVSAQVRLVSGAHDIRVKRLGVDLDRQQRNVEFTLGSGEGRIDLEAGGSILLAGKLDDTPEFEFGPFNVEMDAETQRQLFERTGVWVQQFTDQIETQMEALSAQLDDRLAQLGTSDEIASRVQAKVQQAMRKAEEKIAEAMRQAEQRARAAEREAERMERRQQRSYVYSTPPTPPIPPIPPIPPVPPRAQRAKSAPVSDEERMVILRMVEEGKVSVEQAEKLLAALESSV